jgi:hypothetical protein
MENPVMTLKVLSMSPRHKDGAYRLFVVRESDPGKMLCVIIGHKDAEELAKMAKQATAEDPLFIEVESKHVTCWFPRQVAA